MSEQEQERHATEESDEPDVEAHLQSEFGLQDDAADKGLVDESAERELHDETA